MRKPIPNKTSPPIDEIQSRFERVFSSNFLAPMTAVVIPKSRKLSKNVMNNSSNAKTPKACGESCLAMIGSETSDNAIRADWLKKVPRTADLTFDPNVLDGLVSKSSDKLPDIASI